MGFSRTGETQGVIPLAPPGSKIIFDPLGGAIDGVVVDVTAGTADPGYGRHTAGEAVVTDLDVLGFELADPGAEVGEAGAAADSDGALSGVAYGAGAKLHHKVWRTTRHGTPTTVDWFLVGIGV